MNGPSRIGFEQLQAWQHLTGETLTPAEVRAVIALDRAVLNPGTEADDLG